MKKLIAFVLTLLIVLTAFAPGAFAAGNITVNASVNGGTRLVTISGTISTGSNQTVTLLVTNPSGSVDYINEVKSGEGGAYSASYILDETSAGTYQVTADGQGDGNRATACFTYAGPVITLNASINRSTGVVSISGKILTGAGKKITLLVKNPSGSIDYINEIISGENGNFSVNYTIDETTGGTYEVTANGQTEGSRVTTEFIFLPGNVSEAPVLISAVPGNGQVTLAWSTVSDAVRYNILYGTDPIGLGKQLKLGNVGSYVITGLVNNVTYYFVVFAINKFDRGSGSNKLSAMPAAPYIPPVDPVQSPVPSPTVSPIPLASSSPAPSSAASPSPSASPAATMTPVVSPTPVPSPTPAPVQSASPSPAPSVLPVSSPVAGKVIIKPEKQLNGTATAAVDGKVIEKALETAQTETNNTRTIKLEVAEVEGVTGYTQQLPASLLSNSGAVETRVAIETIVATVVLPDNMFTRSQVGSAANVGISVLQADKSTLSQNVKNQVGDKPVIEINASVDGEKVIWSNDNAPVSISVNYTPTAEELANPEHIVIWYIDGSGNAVPVPNGRYDTATGRVTFTTTHFSTYAVAFVKKTFADAANSWAKREIEVMASKGVIAGNGGKYNPKNQITRADFLKLLISTLGLKAQFSSNFEDVKPGDYFYEYVGIAKKLGITTGDGKNKFNPRAPILRQDMMVLVERALKAAGKIKTGGDVTVLKDFTDAGLIANYAKASVASLLAEGIVLGSNSRISPDRYFTREEAAMIMYRLYYK